MHKEKFIGHKDIADFPEINLFNIPVKIDSGAYTSSIHYYKAKIVEKDGDNQLKVYFRGPKSNKYKESIFLFKEFSKKIIRSSNGQSEERYSIKTKIKLFKKHYKIELTLSKRSKMKFKVLLGRKFLRKKFVIDTSLSYLSKKNIVKYYKS